MTPCVCVGVKRVEGRLSRTRDTTPDNISYHAKSLAASEPPSTAVVVNMSLSARRRTGDSPNMPTSIDRVLTGRFGQTVDGGPLR